MLHLDRYPYMRAEVELMRDAVAGGVPLLGVCLGGQLLAHALGGHVEAMPHRTIEWAAVERLPGAEDDPLVSPLDGVVRALHWNEDCFTVPDGAVELLTRAGPGGEAFRYGDSAWGIQFHPEVDAAALEAWYAEDPRWVADAGVDVDEARAQDRLHLPAQRRTAEAVFGGFASVVAGRVPA